jgi:hypothetical protein
LVDRATKCRATSASPAPLRRNQSRAVWALVRVSWVVKVLEAMMKSVLSGAHLAQDLRDVRAVDVGYEVKIQIGLPVIIQGCRDHARPQIRPADADVDHVGDPLSRIPFHAPERTLSVNPSI